MDLGPLFIFDQLSQPISSVFALLDWNFYRSGDKIGMIFLAMDEQRRFMRKISGNKRSNEKSFPVYKNLMLSYVDKIVFVNRSIMI